MAIAHCGLCHLRDQGLRIAQKQQLHLPISMELFLELPTDRTVSVAGALHDRFQHEDLRLDLSAITHLSLVIVPNKGGSGVAALTSLLLFA